MRICRYSRTGNDLRLTKGKSILYVTEAATRRDDVIRRVDYMFFCIHFHALETMSVRSRLAAHCSRV